MRLTRHVLSRLLCLTSCLVLLTSCYDTPPDIAGCTAIPSVDYYKMRDLFYKLCEQDATCVPKLSGWKAKEVTWAPPMEAAYCTHVISGNGYMVDASHPFPGGKSLKELLTSSVYLPAKESWAPFKTWIQTVCHKTKKCGNDIGKWSDNLDKIEKQADR